MQLCVFVTYYTVHNYYYTVTKSDQNIVYITLFKYRVFPHIRNQSIVNVVLDFSISLFL
jgi:hypothetical protein